MEYKVGDFVRIKTRQELKNRRVHYGSAIDKWQNEICCVCAVVQTIAGQRYKIKFVRDCKDDKYLSAAGVLISDFLWEEFELAFYDRTIEEKNIDGNAYAELIGW